MQNAEPEKAVTVPIFNLAEGGLSHKIEGVAYLSDPPRAGMCHYFHLPIPLLLPQPLWPTFTGASFELSRPERRYEPLFGRFTIHCRFDVMIHAIAGIAVAVETNIACFNAVGLDEASLVGFDILVVIPRPHTEGIIMVVVI